MPYIPQKNRKVLDDAIDELAKRVVEESKKESYDGAFAGFLNYACARLALKVMKLRFGKIRYWLIAIVSGVFKNVGDEFYRRLASPYENKKIAEDGDVDLYEEFSAQGGSPPSPGFGRAGASGGVNEIEK